MFSEKVLKKYLWNYTSKACPTAANPALCPILRFSEEWKLSHSWLLVNNVGSTTSTLQYGIQYNRRSSVNTILMYYCTIGLCICKHYINIIERPWHAIELIWKLVYVIFFLKLFYNKMSSEPTIPFEKILEIKSRNLSRKTWFLRIIPIIILINPKFPQ